MIRWFEHRQVYSPSRKFEAEGAKLGRSFEEVELETADGLRLHGWFFPAKPEAPRAHLALLLLHGNAGNVSHRLHFYEAWLELGLNVFTFDYRGFGKSEGRPGEEGTYRDAQAAVHWLRARGFPSENIVLLGKSLGGGIATETALREPVGALILQNTFTSIPDIGSEIFPWLPVRKLHRIHYDTYSKLPRLTVPVLVAHSPGDALIHIRHAQRNFEAAPEPKMFLELRGSHTSTIESGRELYLNGLGKFLDAYLPPRPTP